MPFAHGPRACLGARFATAESVATLAMLVSAYEILPPADLRGATTREREDALLRWKVLATTTPRSIKLRFRKRSPTIGGILDALSATPAIW